MVDQAFATGPKRAVPPRPYRPCAFPRTHDFRGRTLEIGRWLARLVQGMSVSSKISNAAPPRIYLSIVHRRAVLQRSGYGKQHLRRSSMSNPKLEVLTPQNSQVIFIDQQP